MQTREMNMPQAAARVAVEDILDPERLASLREFQEEGEPDIVIELIEMFLDDLPESLAKLRAAVASGEAKAIERAAHSLKGSGANLGVVRIAAICAEMEAKARSGSPEEAGSMLSQLEAECERVRQALGSMQPAM
jgi:HPt (histidine-containing phosphotransfer) domain-containing protein